MNHLKVIIHCFSNSSAIFGCCKRNRMKHVGFSLADYGIERLNQTKQLKKEIED